MTKITPGSSFEGKYQIESVLGSGGVGTVYKAVESELNRPVAIKVLHSWQTSLGEADSLQRFRREAKVLCQLLHPNILRVYRFGMTDDELPYLVMEFAEGQSLRTVLEEKGPLDFQLAVRVALKLAEALAHSHANGVIHRDLKPENLIVQLSDPSEPMVKLIDFGLCRPDPSMKSTNQRTLTSTGDLLGTAQYMSPEQVLGQQVTEQSDIYSFALIFFEMITGKSPYSDGHPAEVMMRRVNEPIPEILALNPHCRLPKAIDTLIQYCGMRQQSDRCKNFGEVVEQLKALPSIPSGLKYQPPSAVYSAFQKQKKVLLISAAAILLLGLGTAGLIVFVKGPAATEKQIVPEEAVQNSLSSVKTQIEGGNLAKAEELASKMASRRSLESWPSDIKAELFYNYFEMFKKAGDNNVAQTYLVAFFRSGIFTDKSHRPRDWQERLESVSDYLLHDKSIDRNTWRSVGNALGKKTYVGSSYTRLLVDELLWESYIRIWSNPKLEIISEYTKRMAELAQNASEGNFDDKYEYFMERALKFANKYDLTRYKLVSYQVAALHYLKRGNLREADKNAQLCLDNFNKIQTASDVKELKASSLAKAFNTIKSVELALANDAQKRGDIALSKAHLAQAKEAEYRESKYAEAAATNFPISISKMALTAGRLPSNELDSYKRHGKFKLRE